MESIIYNSKNNSKNNNEYKYEEYCYESLNDNILLNEYERRKTKCEKFWRDNYASIFSFILLIIFIILYIKIK